MSKYELRFILYEKYGKYIVGSNGALYKYRMEEEGQIKNTKLRNEMVNYGQIRIGEIIRDKGIVPKLLTFDGEEKSDWVLKE